MSTAAAVEIRNLRKRFNEGPYVLNGLTLSVSVDSITYVLGPSGTGKSVLLKHIVGLEKPDEGEVRVLGKPIPYGDPSALNEMRRIFGVLFQGAALFDSMTVFQNVAFPLVEHRRKIPHEEVRRIVAEKLRAVGLMPERDMEKLPDELSGGMRKRVGLARAIVLEPRILLFDEPTTGLDPVVRDTVDRLICDTSRSLGVTSIVISHDVRSAVELATEIVFLEGGRVIFQGTPDEFVRSDHPFISEFLDAEDRQSRRLRHAN